MAIRIDDMPFNASLYVPSPFALDGRRWRSIQQYIDIIGSSDAYDAVMTMLHSNPVLAMRLASTGDATLVSDKYPLLAKALMTARGTISMVLPPEDEATVSYDIIRRFFDVLRSQEYEHILPIGGVISFDNPPVGDITDLMMEGPNGIGIIDIYLTTKYPEDRLKSIIAKYKDSGVKYTYYLLTSIRKSQLNKLMNIAVGGNVHFFSPEGLYVTPSKHLLSSHVELVNRMDSIYGHIKSISEISLRDPLIREMGLSVGDIILVKDFSPHYRVVV